jgi:hypothetical protein
MTHRSSTKCTVRPPPCYASRYEHPSRAVGICSVDLAGARGIVRCASRARLKPRTSDRPTRSLRMQGRCGVPAVRIRGQKQQEPAHNLDPPYARRQRINRLERIALRRSANPVNCNAGASMRHLAVARHFPLNANLLAGPSCLRSLSKKVVPVTRVCAFPARDQRPKIGGSLWKNAAKTLKN